MKITFSIVRPSSWNALPLCNRGLVYRTLSASYSRAFSYETSKGHAQAIESNEGRSTVDTFDQTNAANSINKAKELARLKNYVQQMRGDGSLDGQEADGLLNYIHHIGRKQPGKEEDPEPGAEILSEEEVVSRRCRKGPQCSFPSVLTSLGGLFPF